MYTFVQIWNEQLTLKGGGVELVHDVSCPQNNLLWEKLKNQMKDVKNFLENRTYVYV